MPILVNDGDYLTKFYVGSNTMRVIGLSQRPTSAVRLQNCKVGFSRRFGWQSQLPQLVD